MIRHRYCSYTVCTTETCVTVDDSSLAPLLGSATIWLVSPREFELELQGENVKLLHDDHTDQEYLHIDKYLKLDAMLRSLGPPRICEDFQDR